MPHTPKPKRVYRAMPDAEQNLKRVLAEKKNAPAETKVWVSIDDVWSVLDELRATRARNAALWREMAAPLPGMEVSDGRVEATTTVR